MIFYNKPAGFNVQHVINVVNCLVQAEGQVLLLQRAAKGLLKNNLDI